ncbi:MAG: hypothetical protein NTX99_11225 [Candidatus Aminicenantes bacterium]|nr:hypothetical protein [Candidatus Aminicenantes bacterium]
MSGSSWSVLLLLAAVVLIPGTPAGAQERTEITAWSVNLGGSVADKSRIDITVERWSTPEERAALAAAFRDGGQDALLEALKKLPKVGLINVPQTPAYDLRYAYKFPAENGGSTLVIATDRRILPGEVWDQTRSTDYPFELIEMHLDAQGQGEGTLSWATRIWVDKDGNLELEVFGNSPVMLTKITAKVKKPR